jgi:hypothetical protein
MTPEEMEHSIETLEGWTDEAADVLNRIIDRLNTIEVRLGDLRSRFDEWETNQ